MKPKVLLYSEVPTDLIEQLVPHCTPIQVKPGEEKFMEHLKTAVGILGSGLTVDENLLDQAPLLKVAANISTGYDNFNIEEMTTHGVMATRTSEVLVDTTADMIFGLLLATARRIPELDRFVKEGKWIAKAGAEQFGVDVHHKKLGIIGMGSIGKAIAERGHHGFKMEILYNNRSQNQKLEKDLGAQYMTLENLLRESDFVCLMAPLTSETRGLMGIEEFRLMKESGIFINGSRGQLVQEKELIEALQTREILAAGLDVYEQEPVDADSPLLKMPNVVTTPHIASGTSETRYNMAKLAVENLISALKGEVPANLINKEVLETGGQYNGNQYSEENQSTNPFHP